MSDDYNVYEVTDSQSGSITNESEGAEVREVTRRLVIGRCENGFEEAFDAIKPYTPQYVKASGEGYWLRKRLNITGIGNAYFDITATYQTLQPKQGEGPENNSDFTPGSLAWDTTGHTEHITQGLAAEVRLPNNAADFEGALNVSGDNVQGLDVVRPSLRYSETWILPAQLAIGCDFIGAVYALTGTVNKNKFRCFAPGEALFMGARAQWNGDQPYVSTTFDWECRPNGDLTMPFVKGVYEYGDYDPGAQGGGGGGAMNKLGWEHIWIRYEAAASNGSLIRKPIAIYKNKVYRQASWDSLGVIAGTVGAQQAGVVGQVLGAVGNGVN